MRRTTDSSTSSEAVERKRSSKRTWTLTSGIRTPAWQDLNAEAEVLHVAEVHSTTKLLQDNWINSKRQRARARFLDVLLGTRQGQWVGLLMVGATLVFSGAVAWSLSGGIPGYDSSWGHALWMSWCLFFDPGTQTGISPNDPAVVRWVALIFSVLGFIYNLSVLGIIVETARSLLTGWKRDRSKIVLNGHLLVLGWTDKTLFLLREVLAEAENIGIHKERVVILADMDEREMNEQVRDHIGDTKGHYVKCQKGCIFNPKDLMRVSVYSARDVIVLARSGPVDAADLEVVRVMVALAALPTELSSRVLAEVRCASMAPVLEALLPDICEGIHARSTINRLLCLMAVSPVVGDCLASLCCFDYGEELYLAAIPELVGKTFRDACRAFKRPILVGIKPGQDNVLLAPPDGRVIEEGDRLVLMSPDMKQIGLRRGSVVRLDVRVRDQVRTISKVTTGAISNLVKDARWDADIKSVQDVHRLSCRPMEIAPPRSDYFIVIGWPDEIGELLFTLDILAEKGSVVHLLCEKTVQEREDHLSKSKVALKHTTLQHYVGKCTAVEWLSALPLAEASAILILAEGQQSSSTSAGLEAKAGWEHSSSIGSDSACLACAVTICSICDGRFGAQLECRLQGRIICEVVDLRTDRMLHRNTELGKRCIFFRSNALEMGLFAMASADPTVFNTLVSLISPMGHIGKFMAIPLGDLQPCGRVQTGETGPTFVQSFWDLHGLVRDHFDGVLVGWQKAETGHWDLCPIEDRNMSLVWKPQDLLIIVRPDDADDGEDSDEATGSEAMGRTRSGPMEPLDSLASLQHSRTRRSPAATMPGALPLPRARPQSHFGSRLMPAPPPKEPKFLSVTPPSKQGSGVDLN